MRLWKLLGGFPKRHSWLSFVIKGLESYLLSHIFKLQFWLWKCFGLGCCSLFVWTALYALTLWRLCGSSLAGNSNNKWVMAQLPTVASSKFGFTLVFQTDFFIFYASCKELHAAWLWDNIALVRSPNCQSHTTAFVERRIKWRVASHNFCVELVLASFEGANWEKLFNL